MKIHSKRALKQTRKLSKTRVSIFAVVFTIFGGIITLLTYADVVTNPTHIVDVQWNFPGSGYDITSISTDLTPKLDPSPDGYFYATEFYYLNNYTGYMGLQANGIDSGGHIVPKTISITIYGATGSTPAAGIQGSCWNPSGEGQQCNLNDVYNWVPGHTYRMYLSLQ